MVKSRLRQILIKNLELKEKEVSIFVLLFFHSFFLGWFIAFYFVSANSVFIVHYGSEQLPYAYIIAGIAGYILSSFYSWLQKKLSTFWLFFSALFFMLIISILGRLGLNYIDEKILSAFVFIWAWPFISLSGIELGGLALRFLNLIQVKRLYGLFNMGGVLAAIISYLAVPAIKPYLNHIYDLLYIGIAGLVISIFILLRLYQKFGKEEQQLSLNKLVSKEKKKSKTTFRELIKEDYFKWIFISATLSMTMIYLTDFGFLSSVKKEIPAEYVPHYLGLVFGFLKIGELIISYYSRRLLSNYGVKLGLTILPVVSASLVFLAAVSGLAFGAGLMMLIIMTLLKSLERILRRGLDDPAFNILYQPLPEDKKLAVQTRVGVVMQVAITIAGVLLWLINNILVTDEGFQLQYFPLFFLPILLLWVYVARKLYLSYKDKIRQILADISKDKRRGTDFYQYSTEILRKRLKNDAQKDVIGFSATVLSEMNPKALDAYANNLIKNAHSPLLIKVVLKNLDPTWRKRLAKVIDEVLEKQLPPDIERLAVYAKRNLDYSEVKELTDEEAVKLAASSKINDRLLIIKAIHKRLYTPGKEILLKLLDDKEKIVKIGAINVAHHIPEEEIILKLIDLLEDVEYRHITANALLDFGAKIIPYLDRFFEENSNIELLLKIIEILAKIGTNEAKESLIRHLDYPNRQIQIAVIFGLFFCKYQADEKTRPLIIKKLEEVIENILWIYATIKDIEDKHNTLKLFLALDLEKEFNFEILFLLLSFLYEPRIITLVQKNIIGKDTIFAIEIMDNFFDQDIKKLVTPLFDDISPAQKIKRLQHLFPQKTLSLEERLKDIIVRDFNKLDPWTVAKALELLGKIYKKQHSKRKRDISMDYSDIKIWTKERLLKKMEIIQKSELPDEVFLALFHTEELVYSTAAKILFDENPVKCFDFLANMSKEKQKLLEQLANNAPLITDKIRLLKRLTMFFNVPENILAQLAKKAEIIKLNKNQELEIFNSHQEWIVFILKGSLFTQAGENKMIYGKNDIIIRGLNIDEFTNKIFAASDSILFRIERLEFFNTLMNEKEIIRYILQSPTEGFWIF